MAKIPKIIEPIDADFDMLADTLLQTEKPKTMNNALYRAPLPIGDVDLECAVLDDENNTRVITMTSVFKAFKRVPRSNNRLINIPAFVDAKNLQPYINQELKGLISQIEYRDEKVDKIGYNALILPEMCDMYLTARRDGALTQKQQHLAIQAEILQSAFAKLGIIALVDEVTGYQEDRAKTALVEIFTQFLTDERQKWTKTFPLDFYREIYRLRGWDFQPWNTKRPSVVAHWTDDFVYDRLAPQITDELRKKNPKRAATGRRKDRHHQWFNTESGHPRLKEHISGVIALLRAADNWESFKVSIDRAYPKFGNTIEMPLTGGSNNE